MSIVNVVVIMNLMKMIVLSCWTFVHFCQVFGQNIIWPRSSQSPTQATGMPSCFFQSSVLVIWVSKIEFKIHGFDMIGLFDPSPALDAMGQGEKLSQGDLPLVSQLWIASVFHLCNGWSGSGINRITELILSEVVHGFIALDSGCITLTLTMPS